MSQSVFRIAMKSRFTFFSCWRSSFRLANSIVPSTRAILHIMPTCHYFVTSIFSRLRSAEKPFEINVFFSFFLLQYPHGGSVLFCLSVCVCVSEGTWMCGCVWFRLSQLNMCIHDAFVSNVCCCGKTVHHRVIMFYPLWLNMVAKRWKHMRQHWQTMYVHPLFCVWRYTAIWLHMKCKTFKKWCKEAGTREKQSGEKMR